MAFARLVVFCCDTAVYVSHTRQTRRAIDARESRDGCRQHARKQQVPEVGAGGLRTDQMPDDGGVQPAEGLVPGNPDLRLRSMSIKRTTTVTSFLCIITLTLPGLPCLVCTCR